MQQSSEPVTDYTRGSLGVTVIFEEIAQLMAAHANHDELAAMLGVHITTLRRWQQQSSVPNSDHEARIREILGEIAQGQLFHTAPGLTQADAIEKYGTPPIPGLLLFCATPVADPYRFKRYADVIEPTPHEATPYRIVPSDIISSVFTTFGRREAHAVVKSVCVERGDVLMTHDQSGHWAIGVMYPDHTPARATKEVLVIRPRGISGHVLARLLNHPIVRHQMMPFSTPGHFSDLFTERLTQAVLPVPKGQTSHLNDWGARLAACTDENHILGNAMGREVEKVAADWQSELSLKGTHDL